MGILNLTEDSFYDGGKNNSLNKALKHTEKMLSEGAFFIDIGVASSKPGSPLIKVDEEKKRLLPYLNALIREFPTTHFSIDTYHSEVAQISLDLGVSMINDISGGQLDSKMFAVVGAHKVPYVMMHMKGTPQTMKDLCQYDDLMVEMRMYFSSLIKRCTELHIHDVIIDPGFGFAKNTEQNFQILRELKEFQLLDSPILIGLSRKSMIYKTLGTNASEALNGTTALNMIALQNGASILRVHDVKEAMECVTLSQNL